MNTGAYSSTKCNLQCSMYLVWLQRKVLYYRPLAASRTCTSRAAPYSIVTFVVIYVLR